MNDDSPGWQCHLIMYRTPHRDQWHLDEATRLLHEDRRINLHESMPLIEPGTIAVTKEEGHAGPKGFRPSHGLDGHPAAQTLAAIGRRHEHSADADEWHGWSIADLNLAEN